MTGLLPALTTGKLDELPDETTFLLARTGLLHLFVSAAFHLWAAALLARALAAPWARFVPAGKPRLHAAFLLRLALTGWVAWSLGPGSGMTRAFTYQTLRAGSRLLEVQPSPYVVFLAAVAVSAAIGRGDSFPFLLSAAGLAGALLLRTRWAVLRGVGPWLFTLPLTIWGFGLFSPWAPLWNATLGAALGSVLLPLAILAALARSAGLALPWLETGIERGLGWWLQGVGAVDRVFGGAAWVPPLPFLFLAVAWLLAAYLFRKRRRRIALALAGIALPLTRLLPLPALAALDVGQGDALFLRTSGGTVMVDAGPAPFPPGNPAAASRRLERMAVGDLDHVLLTHFDSDHRDGLASVLARHRVGGLWFRESELTAKPAPEVLALAERAGVPVRLLGENAAPGGFRCWLAPFPVGNDSSPLCRAETAGGSTVLLTGDMGERAERWLLANVRPFPRAGVLKVAHHGSRTSSTEEFLAASGAKEAWISVGARNRYGHPTAAALGRLEAAGMRVRRTDLEGDLTLYGTIFSAPRTEEIMRVAPGAPIERSRL